MNVKDKKNTAEKISMLILLAVIILLYASFLKEILIPFLRMEASRDLEGAKTLLQEKGLLGFLTVTLVEALQMVVIFIPAEFIQISSGLSYPFWAALLLCDLGVCLGASIIFLLVRNLNFQSTAYEKRKSKIENFSAAVHERNAVLFMYLLFFMPIIPFGAICYYGSGQNLDYGKYIRTVATGVIPSIIVSNLMGEAGSSFLKNDIPMWILVCIIIFLAVLLFAVIYLFINKFILKEYDGTPDSPVYALVFAIVRLWHGRRPKPVIDDEKLKEAEVPYILLSNHESFFDFYYIYQMRHPRNPTFLVNEYYCTRPVLKSMAKKAGILSKKLFTPELSYPIRIKHTLKRGYPIVIFPEGRLSPDGRTNPIVEEGAAFYKRMGADLVLVKISGAYYTYPKWRRTRYRNSINVSVQEVINKDALNAMSDEELNAKIYETLYNDASENTEFVYKAKNKAEGLENLLYRCHSCGSLYTVESAGNDIRCTACGRKHTIDDSYRFTDEPFTIPAWYDAIKEMERKDLESVRLETAVRTVIHGAGGGPTRKETGVCRFDRDSFSYTSENVSFSIPAEKIPALAFSCGEEFELYYENEQYYFYPEEERRQVARWGLLADLFFEERLKENGGEKE